jgi:hypothetical protein
MRVASPRIPYLLTEHHCQRKQLDARGYRLPEVVNVNETVGFIN